MNFETIKTHGPTLKTFYYHRILPDDIENMKGCILVLHGLEGHGKRYEYLGEVLAENGYGLFAIDHIAHGMTALDDKQLGDWYPKDFDKTILNAYFLSMEIKRAHPGKPFFLLGNDFGGYFVQYMLNKHSDTLIPDGVILSGCGLNNPMLYKLYLRSFTNKKIFHDRFQSNKIFNMRIKMFNKPFTPNRTTYDWLTSDEDEVDRFIIDRKSGFIGTIGYYHEYYSNIIKIPEFLQFYYTPKTIPMLFLGGGKDVVTRNGKDIRRIEKFYRKKGFEDIETIIYPEDRHDVYFEVNKDEVISDTLRWLDSKVNKTSFSKEGYRKVDDDLVINVEIKKEEIEEKIKDSNPYLINNKK